MIVGVNVTFSNCEQPRGKGTLGYRDLVFQDQYLRRYERISEK